MKVHRVCVLVLVVGAALHVCGLPVQPKQRENAARLGGGRPAGGFGQVPGLDKNEYMRYWEEAVRNNPDIAQRITELQSRQNLDLEQVAAMYPQFGERLARDSRNVRSQVEEARRMGIEEVRQLQRLQTMRDNNLMPDGDWMTRREAMREHLPPHFTNEDIQNRLKEKQKVLSELDDKRAEEFKRYEMKVEHQRREKLKAMDEKKRLEAEEQFRKLQDSQRHHEKLRHPASKDQLEEVWEKDDGLKREEFDPKTFFFLHDTNGDKYLDPMEIEALFRNELKKVYGNDLNGMEAHEDLARMREHVVKEVDANGDGFVSLQEFLKYTGDQGFANNNEAWDPVVDETPFSEEELEQYEDDYYEYYDYEYDSKGKVVGLKPHPNKKNDDESEENEPAVPNDDDDGGDRDTVREDGLNRNPPPSLPPRGGQVVDDHGRMLVDPAGRQLNLNDLPAGRQLNLNELPRGQQLNLNELAGGLKIEESVEIPRGGGQRQGGENTAVDREGDQGAEPVVAKQQQNNVDDDGPVKMDDIQLNMNALGGDSRAQQFEKNRPVAEN